MPTALDLFWDLSQPAKDQRLDTSTKLVNALQLFQQSHLAQLELSSTETRDLLSLDGLNAPDVAYALKRLVRGLASPRESSRLGFAVALTEESRLFWVRESLIYGKIAPFTFGHCHIQSNNGSCSYLIRSHRISERTGGT